MKKYFAYAIVFFLASIGATFASDQETIMANEKAAWQAYSDKKADEYKKLLTPSFMSVYSDGIYNLQGEVDQMSKLDMKSFTFSDQKVTFTGTDLATITYRVKMMATYDGKDISGDHNGVSVWKKEGSVWKAIMHSDMKADASAAGEAQKKE